MDLETVFSDSGPLARALPDFRPRPFQLEMARAVERAIREKGMLVAEAGTGTGKTVAYLVPALLAGGKVIVSTGTKTLQDQLFDRDLPMARAALKVPATVALLKGRANYVCRHHLERNLEDARLQRREEAIHLAAIADFARTSTTGDRTDCAGVPEDSPAWLRATSTRDNCLGSACPHYDACFVMEARRHALEADVVIVNHHLFFADMALREEGVAELLPACNTVIFDEAHQLPQTATVFFSESVSTSQLVTLARDVRVESAAAARDYRPLPEAAEKLDRAARDLRLALPQESGRLHARQLETRREFGDALTRVLSELDRLALELKGQGERSEGLKRCWQRALELAERLERWRSDATEARVKWVELFAQSLQFHATPLSIAELFERRIANHPRAWVFTSATLSVNRDFTHYCGQMGLTDARTASWDSPYDYAEQALLYIPDRLPEPNSAQHTEAIVELALPLIAAAGGGAFLLFTTLRAMRYAHELLRQAFQARGWRYPLLVQGETSRSGTLERFRDEGNAVLVASHSFWEGVDVPGRALSLVVIDKLPFASPDDPVLAARIEHMQREGRNAFTEYQLPEAVITLKQGAGRLIRGESDRGVLMIGDPRLMSRGYGRRIRASLPPMRLTRRAEEAVAFLSKAEGQTAAATMPSTAQSLS